jgi:ATP-binding cassette subfamily B protein
MPSTCQLVKRLLKEHGRHYAPLYACVVLCMLLVAAMTSISAFMLKYVIDTIFVQQNTAALVGITLTIVGIFLIKGFAAYFSEVLLGIIGSRLVAETQKRMFDHLLHVDLAYFQQHNSSDLIARLTFNANSVRDMLSLTTLNIGRDLFTVIGLVCTMIVLDPLLAAIALLGGPAAIFCSRGMVSRLKRATRSETLSMSGIVHVTRELSQGAAVVKSFQLENSMRRRMHEAADAVQRLSARMLRIQAGVNPLIEAIGGVAFAGVVFYAGWRNLYHGESPGQFFAFMTALLMCADPSRRLSRVQLQLAGAAVGVHLMYELLDTPAKELETEPKRELKVAAGTIELRDVHFSYVEGQRVLDGLSLVAPRGNLTALVGPSGAGKSTLIALLQRLREPESGVISIDGQAIAHVSRSSLRRNISYVGQDAFLFETSILENIRAGLDGASHDECVAAAKSAHAHDFISQLPHGYDTQVGELATQVSGGQRQRIALARAYLKNAPIILLDEPTSALDSETEEIIQHQLRVLTAGKTTIVIAHRLSTILHADLIHVIEAGRVVESGSHMQLLARGGTYSRLFRLQFARLQATGTDLSKAV